MRNGKGPFICPRGPSSHRSFSPGRKAHLRWSARAVKAPSPEIARRTSIRRGLGRESTVCSRTRQKDQAVTSERSIDGIAVRTRSIRCPPESGQIRGGLPGSAARRRCFITAFLSGETVGRLNAGRYRGYPTGPRRAISGGRNLLSA